jgi:hypothetical protein
MSKYIIVSDLVGEPGAEFIPGECINVEALLQGGFIKTETKTKTKTKEDDTHGN